MRVALGGGHEGGAKLGRVGAQGLQTLDVLAAAHAAGGDQGHLALDPGIADQLAHRGQHGLELEARLAEVGHLGRAQMPGRMRRVLDDDGAGQAALALPFLPQQGHAAGVGQDGDQRGLRVVLGQLGQVQGQAGADDHGVDALLQRSANRGGVVGHRTHDVHGQQAAAAGDGPRALDLARQGLLIRLLDDGLLLLTVRQTKAARHQIRVMAAQVHRGDGSPGSFRRHGARQAVRRNAHAHAALHDGQQRASCQIQGAQAGAGNAVE
jgi:hypothetical protein